MGKYAIGVDFGKGENHVMKRLKRIKVNAQNK